MERHVSRGHAGTVSSLPVAGTSDLDALEFAEYLRAERERRRLTLEQVSGETKIAPKHLAALERGDVREWPGGMYRRAMMRAYAESIGLDREFALTQFEQVFEAQPPTPEPIEDVQVEPPPARRSRPALPTLDWRPSRSQALAAGASLLALTAVAIVWIAVASFTADRQPAIGVSHEPVAAVRAEEPPATTPQAAAIPASAPAARRPEGRPLQQPHPTVTAPASPAPSSQSRLRPQAVATNGITASPPLATDATLVVESVPSGARVTVNGIGWGNTPVTIRHLEFGAKRVRLTLQDHLSEERVVQFGPGQPNNRVAITLRRRR